MKFLREGKSSIIKGTAEQMCFFLLFLYLDLITNSYFNTIPSCCCGLSRDCALLPQVMLPLNYLNLKSVCTHSRVLTFIRVTTLLFHFICFVFFFLPPTRYVNINYQRWSEERLFLILAPKPTCLLSYEILPDLID